MEHKHITILYYTNNSWVKLFHMTMVEVSHMYAH